MGGDGKPYLDGYVGVYNTGKGEILPPRKLSSDIKLSEERGRYVVRRRGKYRWYWIGQAWSPTTAWEIALRASEVQEVVG